MATGHESLSNMELRVKLLEYGYDIPVSVKKDFMLKTLERAIEEKRKQRLQGRKSMPAMSSQSRDLAGPSNNHNNQFETNSNASNRSRQSTGSSRASLPKQSRPLQPITPDIPEDMELDDYEDQEEEEEQESSPRKSQSSVRSSNRSSGSSATPPSYSSRLLMEPEAEEDGLEDGEEEEDDEEEENRTPSPRYQKYLKFFKGDSKAGDLFEMPRSQYGSPVSGSGSPYSTRANVGSPSFRNQSFDDSADDSDTDQNERMQTLSRNSNQTRMRSIFNKVNPANWMPNPKVWMFSKAKQETDQNHGNQLNFNFGSGMGGGGSLSPNPVPSTSTRYSTNSGANNGHNFGSPSARLANQIYSPSPPPPIVVPPAMAAAGRQAGFKAFFSRGERNGHGYTAPGSRSPADSSHLVPKLILVCFLVAIIGILGAYYYKAAIQPGLPGPEETEDLSAFFGEEKYDSKSQAPPSTKPKRVPTTLNYPICGKTGHDTEPCMEENLMYDSAKIFEALRSELTKRSKDKGCGGLVEDKVSLHTAKELLYRLVDLDKSAVDKAFKGMLMLVMENPTFGMRIESTSNEITEAELNIRDIPSLDYAASNIFVEGVSPSFGCMIVELFFSIFKYIGYLLVVTILGMALYKGIKYRQQRQARQEEEVFKLIDTIVYLLQEHYEESRKGDQEQNYLAVNHIRDQLFSPRERKQKEVLWNQVVSQISNNESRVRQEIQHISGEEFRVWRWLPSASPLSKRMSSAPNSPGGGGDAPIGLYPNLGSLDLDSSGASNPSSPNSKWQGQAFEIFDGSPNSLAQTPTTCLKIRQMFDDSKDVGDFRIEQAILEKCSNAQILHIGIDRSSREGCVYIRCLTKIDARAAYGSLHGWWFDGHLLSVKFLREDRYFSRFPDAKFRTAPISVSNVPPSRPVVQPLSGQQTFNNSMNNAQRGSSSQGFIGGSSPRNRFSVPN